MLTVQELQILILTAVLFQWHYAKAIQIFILTEDLPSANAGTKPRTVLRLNSQSLISAIHNTETTRQSLVTLTVMLLHLGKLPITG